MASKTQLEKNAEFRQKVLWAAHHFGGYITSKNASEITGYSMRSVLAPLRRLVEQKLFIEHKVVADGSQILIFAISKSGREFVEGDQSDAKAFSIKNFRASTLAHEMTMQRLAAEINFESNLKVSGGKVIGGQRKGNRLVGGRRCDGILNGSTAMELELTIKSLKRYKTIFSIYLEADVTSCWFVPTELLDRFEKIIKKLVSIEDYELFTVYELTSDGSIIDTKGNKTRLEKYQKYISEQEARAKQAELEKKAQAEQYERERHQADIDRQNKLAERENLNKRSKILYFANWVLVGVFLAAIGFALTSDHAGSLVGYFVAAFAVICFFISSFERFRIEKYLSHS